MTEYSPTFVGGILQPIQPVTLDISHTQLSRPIPQRLLIPWTSDGGECISRFHSVLHDVDHTNEAGIMFVLVISKIEAPTRKPYCVLVVPLCRTDLLH